MHKQRPGNAPFRDAAEDGPGLLSQSQAADEIVVPVDVAPLQVIEQAATLAHQLEQPPTRVIVFLVRLEVVRQFVNPLRQQRDLHFRRTRVGRMRFVLGNDAQLRLFC